MTVIVFFGGMSIGKNFAIDDWEGAVIRPLRRLDYTLTSENDSFVIKPTNFTEVRKIIMSLKK